MSKEISAATRLTVFNGDHSLEEGKSHADLRQASARFSRKSELFAGLIFSAFLLPWTSELLQLPTRQRGLENCSKNKVRRA
jgi:hypothetical protein